VDKEPFRALLKYQRPTTKDNEIPHRQKLRDEIVEKAKDGIQRLSAHFAVSSFIYLCPYLSLMVFRLKYRLHLMHGHRRHMIPIWP
jgi:hypothetical protein